MQQLDPVFGEQHNPAEIAALLGLAMDDLLLGQAIETVSKGTAFVLVALRSVEALGRMRYQLSCGARPRQEWRDDSVATGSRDGTHK